MIQVALIFPGQGAQTVGMGREFYEQSPKAKEVFEKGESILKNGLLDAAFQGPQEKLTLTAYCQPAIFTFSLAALSALKAHPKFQNIKPRFAAGLSLGEYTALVAAGALSFEEALRLVERRSFFMEEATRVTAGKMAAIIGFDQNRLKEICQKTGAEIANFNSHEQIVITGHARNVEAACEIIEKEGAKGVVMLDVAGAFHSSLMQPAALKFKEELKKVKILTPEFPILSNVDGIPQSDPVLIRENLTKQITSSVQWVRTVEHIAREGVVNFMEIGPGKVLKGLIRRINPSLKIANIERLEDIENLPF